MHHLQVLKDYLLGIQNPLIITIEGDRNEITLAGDRTMNVTPVFVNNSVIGVSVDNLGAQPFLPIEVFVATISLLSLAPGYCAIKGSAMGGRLGTLALPINSVEGHVANIVYGKITGQSVFQRITPISRILQAAGVCNNPGNGTLTLM